MNGICIVGSSKTGTTGVYSSVKQGLREVGRPFFGLHEKYDAAVMQSLAENAPERIVVAKMLLTNNAFSADLASTFDQRVLIVRDPRDTLVSVMLYYPVRAVNRGASDADIASFIELVRTKEKDPEALTFLELLVAVYSLMRIDVTEESDFARRFNRTIKYAKRVPSYLLRYEDFVLDELEPLSQQLGFAVRNTRPSTYNEIVYRTGSFGNWRQWFTPADVEHFRPMLQRYMVRFGYEDDWELASAPAIDPADGSQYVDRAVEKRRRQLALNARQGDEREQLAALRDRADDGSVTAAYRVAALLLRGASGPAERDEIYERAYFAACAGHAPAMGLLARCYREGIGVAPDPAKAKAWERSPVAPAHRRVGRVARGAVRRARRFLSR